MNVEIVRFAYLRDATLGYLSVDGLDLCTLEEPWSPDPDGPGGQRREGNLRESCVPDGRYELIPHDGPSKKDVWALRNVALGIYYPEIPAGQKWGRNAILIHAGNSTDDILGCIAIGMRHGYQGQRPFVYESQQALNMLRAKLQRNRHELWIRATAGTSESIHV